MENAAQQTLLKSKSDEVEQFVARGQEGDTPEGKGEKGGLELSQIRWSLWISTFAAINILLYGLLSNWILPSSSPLGGDLLSESLGSSKAAADSSAHLFVYCVVLGVLSIASVIALFYEERFRITTIERALHIRSDILLLAAVTILGIFSVISLVYFSAETRGAVEQSVWGVFLVAWWLACREYLRARILDPRTAAPSNHYREAHPEIGGQEETYTVEAGMVAPCALTVQRGLCLVRLSGEVNPVLRQRGDVVPKKALVVKGRFEGSEVVDKRAERFSWTSDVAARLRLVEQQRSRVEERYISLGIATWLLLISGGALALLYLYEPAASYREQLIAAIVFSLFAAALIDLRALIRTFRAAVVERLFEGGVSTSSLGFLSRLQEIQRVVFRIGARSPLVGAGKVSEFALIDKRVDSSRFFGVVFALLRNAEDPSLVAIRDYCYSRSMRPELFGVDNEYQFDGQQLSGVVQGAPFLIGTEEALIAKGVHLEVSEAFYSQAELKTRYYVAVGVEIVGYFEVEPPFFAEMPFVVEELRKLHIRPILEGVDVDESELDQLGKALGFELADIRTISSANRRDGEAISDTERKTLYIYLSPEEAPAPVATDNGASSSSQVGITWFRESLWNVGFPGLLFCNRSLSPIVSLLSLSRVYMSVSLGLAAVIAVSTVGLLAMSFFAPQAFALGALISVSVASTGALFLYILSRRFSELQ